MARGERSEEVWAWYEAVYEAIQEIPFGKVTSYGHIARLVGKPECPRQVGVCLKNLPSPSTDPTKKDPKWNSGNVPWQRVINSKGGISPRSVLGFLALIKSMWYAFVDERQRGPSGASRHAAALRAEGVAVEQSAMGEFTVDLGRFGWFPDMLPSEAGLVESSDEENEEEAAYHT